jgi:hypothetical protein
MERDFTGTMKAVCGLTTIEITGDGAEHLSSALDLGGCRNGVLLVNVGEMAVATNVLTVQVTTCDTSDGTFADVLAADEEIDVTEKNTLHTFDLSYMERYVKFQYKVTNGKTALFGATIVGWAAPVRPVP